MEEVCQLCGVSFAIGRLRSFHEPLKDSWDHLGSIFVEKIRNRPPSNKCGPDTGCSFPERVDYARVVLLEHVAGPGCILTTAYNGNRITAQEMKGCRYVQCLAKKDKGWQAEADDQDFELESGYFLTGLVGGHWYQLLWQATPARHGVSEIQMSNLPPETIGGLPAYPRALLPAIPFHPTCFEIFKKISRERLGKVDIEGFWFLREIEDFFDECPRDQATRNGNGHPWYHQPGHEYLAANPIEIPGLATLLHIGANGLGGADGVRPATSDHRPRGVIDLHSENQRLSEAAARDPFHELSNEVAGFVLDNLGSKDIANLRLVSTKFGQLPDILFQRLVLEDMPWLWETREFFHTPMCWFGVYWKAKFELGHLKGLVNRKRIWKMVEESVRRIEKYRDEGKIDEEKEKEKHLWDD
ncbi:MAG: hypothetical protein Q9191_008242 [Dirinaria sp. TL-2023a]